MRAIVLIIHAQSKPAVIAAHRAHLLSPGASPMRNLNDKKQAVIANTIAVITLKLNPKTSPMAKYIRIIHKAK
ncbi:MAG: hypothetical protein Q8P07_05030 [bacterium]|nr:hypothetical protein [bacterium]